MERKKCPYCGEEIAASAKKCRFCGEWLEKPEQPIPHQPMSQQPNPQQPTQQQPMPQQPTIAKQPAKKGFFQTYLLDGFLHPYADFSGISSRKEFWLAYLAIYIVSSGISGLAMLIMGLGGTTGLIICCVIAGLFSLGLFIPSIAISVRRLRDAGLSPWLILLMLIPVIGTIALIVMFCRPSRYQHEDKKSGFNVVDIIVTAVSVILLIAGPIVGMTAGLGSDFGNSKKYDLGDATELEEDYELNSIEEPIEAAEPEIEAVIDTKLNMSSGTHALTGNFYYGSQSFPVKVDYTVDGSGNITKCTYYNISQQAKFNMEFENYGDNLILTDKGGSDFNISLHYEDGQWVGIATADGKSLRVELQQE